MLELEVVESDGRIALAVLSHRGGETGREDAATISRAGQLIGYLLSKAHSEGHEAMPLNARQALADAPLTRAQDILPRLKEAIVRSGMFYESHQAEWVEGRLARTELLREPQGRLSAYPESPAERALPPSSSLPAESAPLAQTAGSVVATQIQNIVHQQLEALANQTFVWQGLLWPGQEMRLEIEEDGRNHQDEEGNAEQGWHTRLKLSFPRLGAINAKLRLHDRQVSLTLCLDQERSLDIMRAETETLRQSLKEAGLILASLAFYHEPAQTS